MKIPANYQASYQTVQQAMTPTTAKTTELGKISLQQLSQNVGANVLENITRQARTDIFSQPPVLRYGVILPAPSESSTMTPMYGVALPPADSPASQSPPGPSIVMRYGISIPPSAPGTPAGGTAATLPPAPGLGGIIGHVVAQGPNRLEGLVRETMADLQQVDPGSLDPQQKTAFDLLQDVYKLIQELVSEMIQLSQMLQSRLGGMGRQ
ncbi:MAG: hypothetical protein JXQ27_13585 [Acidobacteria bacterium]|nr:hypothetical protein [Acidobacteriota bacterium]